MFIPNLPYAYCKHHIQVHRMPRFDHDTHQTEPNAGSSISQNRRTASHLKMFLQFQRLFSITSPSSQHSHHHLSPPSYHVVDTNSTLVGLCPHVRRHKLTNGSRYLLNISFILCEVIECMQTIPHLGGGPPGRLHISTSYIRIEMKIEEKHTRF